MRHRPAREGIRKCNYKLFTATYGLAGPFKVLLLRILFLLGLKCNNDIEAKSLKSGSFSRNPPFLPVFENNIYHRSNTILPLVFSGASTTLPSPNPKMSCPDWSFALSSSNLKYTTGFFSVFIANKLSEYPRVLL